MDSLLQAKFLCRWPSERGFLTVLPENGFYEDHTTLVVILCTLQQSFPYRFLLFQCWGPCGILHWTIHTENFPERKDTLGVRHRGTSSFDTSVVTDLGEGARQKILIHQVFNRSVKVWARCEGHFHPHVRCPGRPGNELFLFDLENTPGKRCDSGIEDRATQKIWED